MKKNKTQTIFFRKGKPGKGQMPGPARPVITMDTNMSKPGLIQKDFPEQTAKTRSYR
jgi:hypothetical protein